MQELNMTQLLSVDDIPDLHSDVVVIEPFIPVQIESNPLDRSEDLADDYAFTRNLMRMQQQMGMVALEAALENARGSDAPRMMEVFAGMMSTMTSVNKEAMNMHKNMKDITSEQTKIGSGSNQPTQQITTQNVFVGTPAELMSKVGTQYEARAEKVINQEASVIEDVA